MEITWKLKKTWINLKKLNYNWKISILKDKIQGKKDAHEGYNDQLFILDTI